MRDGEERHAAERDAREAGACVEGQVEYDVAAFMNREAERGARQKFQRAEPGRWRWLRGGGLLLGGHRADGEQ